MATPMIIGLRIAGTKQRQSGFAPLLSVGVLAGGEGENMDRVTMVAEKPSYIIKHAPDYILYGLVDRKVKSFDAEAPGVLSIALTIPSKKQLANGASPYTLLREVYDLFVSNYMTRISDGRDSFLDKDCDPVPFQQIVGRYTLEDRYTPYIPMNPTGLTGTVCVPQSDLEAFFRNTQYKEFESFKDIEVGIDCQKLVTPGLDNLQIPLPQPSYEVYVDREPTGIKLQLPGSPSYTASKESNSYYTYDTVDISLKELLEAPEHEVISGRSRIKLDMEKNRIMCDLGKSEVYYDFVFVWGDNAGDGRKQVETLATQGKLKLYFGSEDMTNTLFSENPRIRAIDIRGRKVDIRPKSYNEYIFSAQSSQDEVSHQILVNITINKRRVEKPVIPTRETHRDESRPLGMNNAVNTSPNQGKSPYDRPVKKQGFNLKSFIFGVLIGLAIGVLITILISILTSKGDNKTQPEDQPTTEVSVDTLNQNVHEGEQGESGEDDNQGKGEDSQTVTSDGDAGGATHGPTPEEIAQQEKLKAEQAAAAAKQKAADEAAQKKATEDAAKKKVEQTKQSKAKIEQAYNNLKEHMSQAQTKVNRAGKKELSKISIPSNVNQVKSLNEIYTLDNRIKAVISDKNNLKED